MLLAQKKILLENLGPKEILVRSKVIIATNQQLEFSRGHIFRRLFVQARKASLSVTDRYPIVHCFKCILSVFLKCLNEEGVEAHP